MPGRWALYTHDCNTQRWTLLTEAPADGPKLTFGIPQNLQVAGAAFVKAGHHIGMRFFQSDAIKALDEVPAGSNEPVFSIVMSKPDHCTYVDPLWGSKKASR